MSIISVTDLKTHMGQPSGETTDNTLLANIIAEIEEYIQNVVCQRQFASAEYTEYYDGDGEDKLFLDNFPIVSVTSIYDDPDRVYPAGTLIASTNYILYKRYGYVQLYGSVFSAGAQNIKITYKGGYGTGAGEIAMPNDIKMALKDYMLAKYLLQKGQIQAISETSNRIRPDILMKEAMKVFDLYKTLGRSIKQ